MKLVLIKDFALVEFLQEKLGDSYVVLVSDSLDKAVEVYEI